MYIKIKIEIPYKDATFLDSIKILFSPFIYVIYTINEPTILKILVLLSYILLLSFVIIYA